MQNQRAPMCTGRQVRVGCSRISAAACAMPPPPPPPQPIQQSCRALSFVYRAARSRYLRSYSFFPLVLFTLDPTSFCTPDGDLRLTGPTQLLCTCTYYYIPLAAYFLYFASCGWLSLPSHYRTYKNPNKANHFFLSI